MDWSAKPYASLVGVYATASEATQGKLQCELFHVICYALIDWMHEPFIQHYLPLT